MKKITMLFALILSLYGVQAQAGTAVGARGGKKAVARMLDSSGGPIGFNDDKPWKVYESTSVGPFLVVDESGVAPKQGMINRVCIGTAPVSAWAVVYDTNTIAGPDVTDAGIRISPLLIGSATATQCFTLNALFTSGAAVEISAGMVPVAGLGGGVYVYWRELGGYR